MKKKKSEKKKQSKNKNVYIFESSVFSTKFCISYISLEL